MTVARISLTLVLMLWAANAAILSPSLNTGWSPPSSACWESSLTTAAPVPFKKTDLRKRNNRHNICGYGGVGTAAFTWSCVDTNAYCAATILSNEHAYRYCSTSGAAEQWAATTAIASCTGSASQSLVSALCCDEPHSMQVATLLWTADNYTVTDFGCFGFHGTFTGAANTNLINPSSFSASLVQATAPMTTSSSSVPSITSTTPVPKSAMSTTPGSKDSGDSGLSTGTKAGIGAGIGVGVGIAIIAGAVFLFWRRNQRKKQNNPASGASHTPQMAYNQPSYFEAQPKQGSYAQGSPPPQWSPNPQSPQSGSTDYGMSATYSPVEAPGPVPHELQAPTNDAK